MTSTTIPADSVLSPSQRAVARRVIDEESHAREHVVVYLSGAHAYGFPSPDSDLDLKAIHVVPTRALLGLAAASSTSDRIGIEDDIEIDYTSNELGHALRGMLHGNGNYLERVLGATWLRSSELHAPLA
ncbi:MAG: nucleotidyltransferase domain-containing protein, partial [Deltaproteobacteria bacterium]|nr:nucleotidyltransferase domain-containing protein [Deltaproteobacteria bacterium]